MQVVEATYELDKHQAGGMWLLDKEIEFSLELF